MNKASLVLLGAVSVLVAGWTMKSSTLDANAAATPKQPNFIVFYGEGAGWVSTSVQMDERNPASKGTTNKTPNLERLAAAGMRFSDGYAPSPRCTPSRATIFTGRSPAALHMTFVGIGDGMGAGNITTKVIPVNGSTELPLEETTIAELLKTVGYASAHFGKWHVGSRHPSQHGFDESDGPTSNGGPDNVSDPNPKQTLAMAQEGISFMEKQVKAGKPFYLQLSQYPNQGAKSPAEVSEEANIIDSSYGQVMDAVQRLGIKDNTYIVYTTDHGTQGKNTPLSGGKGDVLEGGIRVPFFVAGPGIKANTISHVRVSGADLFPTFAALAGVKEAAMPKGVEGGSLLPVLTNAGVGEVKRVREEFVVHFPHYDKNPQGPASSIFLGDYKMTRLYETGQLKLFDVSKDPSESNDLAKQMPAKVAELDARLTAYLKDVNAQMPSMNPNADPTASAASLPGERNGGGMDAAAGMAAGGMAGGMAAAQ